MSDFRIVVHKAEEGGFWAEIPAFPGCVSEGETLEETKANIIDAAKGWLTAKIRWALSRKAHAVEGIGASKDCELVYS